MNSEDLSHVDASSRLDTLLCASSACSVEVWIQGGLVTRPKIDKPAISMDKTPLPRIHHLFSKGSSCHVDDVPYLRPAIRPKRLALGSPFLLALNHD
jgi:hypothetical protein